MCNQWDWVSRVLPWLKIFFFSWEDSLNRQKFPRLNSSKKLSLESWKRTCQFLVSRTMSLLTNIVSSIVNIKAEQADWDCVDIKLFSYFEIHWRNKVKCSVTDPGSSKSWYRSGRVSQIHDIDPGSSKSGEII